MRRWPRLLAVALLLVLPRPLCAARGAVATEHRAAAEAGAAVLAWGGSAVDTAIATAAAVCVVHPSSCGVGGGGFALVWHAGQAHALDFRETAPNALRPALFLDGGRPQPQRSREGGLAVGVPGEVAGWVALHERFGRLPLATVLAPAIRLARDGFALGDSPHLARQVARAAPLLRADPGLASVFLDRGRVPAADFVVRQTDLARLLERVARERRAAFYEGATPAAIAEAVRRRGGVMRADDVRRYLPVWRRPVSMRHAGRTVVTFPPPGSGAVVLAVLGIVGDEALDGGVPPELLAGALARGFADRARWFGDPAFTTVPLAAMLAPGRLARLRGEIVAGAGAPADVPAMRDAGTAHVSVLTADGDAVALTTTINTAFGAGVMVPGTGIILNNEMDDFVVVPGVANVYGLGGGTPNVVAPRKRPQSSMAPTIVVRDGRAELAVGASGGPFIISATAQVLLQVLNGARAVPDAVTAPRLHDQ
ncbi:MAG TPA: gamma-glutamyltransferase family protein, partial [Candidatus Limnocylindria bacterium]|nr:gamma-glutamyltransferase family protein [Candidatus Limnocylindria bacterium]